MKTKNFKKKLVLNKKTVVNLGKTTMGKVHGGNTGESECYATCIIMRCVFVNPIDIRLYPMPK